MPARVLGLRRRGCPDRPRLGLHGRGVPPERSVHPGLGVRGIAVVAAPRPHDVMRPITCWPLSANSAKSYEAWRKTVKR